MSRLRLALCIFASPLRLWFVGSVKLADRDVVFFCSSSILNFSCVVSSRRSRPTPFALAVSSVHVVCRIGCGSDLHRHTTWCPFQWRIFFAGTLGCVSSIASSATPSRSSSSFLPNSPYSAVCGPRISIAFCVGLSSCSSLDGNPRCSLLERAGSICPSGGCCVLCPPLLPHAYVYALTTVYLALSKTLECRVFPIVVAFGLLEQEMPFASSRSHANARCILDEAKFRTPTMMQTCNWTRCDLSTTLSLPRVTCVLRSVVADL